MTDIVQRLREDTRSAVSCALSEEAADEIERLREDLRLVRRALKEECDHITDELSANPDDALIEVKELP